MLDAGKTFARVILFDDGELRDALHLGGLRVRTEPEGIANYLQFTVDGGDSRSLFRALDAVLTLSE